MHKHNLVMKPPPDMTWREQARRALTEPSNAPPTVELRFVARPAAWEGRRHLEALERQAGPRVVIRALALADLGRREVAV